MDGVAAITALLTGNAALTQSVPTARIQPGVLSQGTPLPAISIESISKVDLNIPSAAAKRFVTERVQVTVLAKDYPSQKAILRAVKRAAADRLYPAVPGISGVTVHTESAGPDFMNEAAKIFIGSQDFAVRYNEES